jgi:hypothetical protein
MITDITAAGSVSILSETPSSYWVVPSEQAATWPAERLGERGHRFVTLDEAMATPRRAATLPSALQPPVAPSDRGPLAVAGPFAATDGQVVLAGVEQVDWPALEQTHGSAERVPAILGELAAAATDEDWRWYQALAALLPTVFGRVRSRTATAQWELAGTRQQAVMELACALVDRADEAALGLAQRIAEWWVWE